MSTSAVYEKVLERILVTFPWDIWAVVGRRTLNLEAFLDNIFLYHSLSHF
jgi:hypothetical protein